MTIQRKVYSVSELTSGIKALLENSFPFIWITGEISNFNIPASGHFYFTLKDKNAQISAVMFRSQNQNLKFTLEHGMSVTGFGRIGVYEPRGTYQIILEYLEPRGIGDLQLAYEQLKARLSAEGLFDEKYKKPIPFMPHKISIITSPTGAVVHDILTIINRRFQNIHIEIIPVKVQGDGAEKEIAYSLELLNKRSDSDVAILARGGGSLEDLYAFNSEIVARAIFASEIPVISAVGHETDFTIADFVSDLRAPTPSAAAELAVPLKKDLKQRNRELIALFKSRLNRYIDFNRAKLREISNRLVHPKKQIEDLRLKTDDYTTRLIRIYSNSIHQKTERLCWWRDRLYANAPLIQANNLNLKLEQNSNNLHSAIQMLLNGKHAELKSLTGRLHALSPVAILNRGYSITRTIPEAIVIRDAASVNIGQKIEVLLAEGSLTCCIERKNTDGKENI